MITHGDSASEGCFTPEDSLEHICAWADRAIEKGVCTHAAKGSLVQNEGALYAILDVPCFARGCRKKSKDELLLIPKPNYRPDKSPRAVKAQFTVSGYPARSLKMPNATRNDHGRLQQELDWEVFPSYKKLKPHPLRPPISFIPGEVDEDASIEVEVRSRMSNPRLEKSLVSLNFVVPSRKALDMHWETIVAETLGYLMMESWRFLREKVQSGNGDDNAILSLNIGNVKIDAAKADKSHISEAVKASGVLASLSPDQIKELEGINRQLKNKTTLRDSLRGEIGNADTARDEAQTKAKLTRTIDEIAEIQQQAWKLIEETGQVGLSSC